MPFSSTISIDGRIYSLRAWHHKLGGRGKGAPDEFGADGVFQMEVLDESGSVVRRKALLFQGKKEWRGTDRRLLQQVEDMTAYSSSAIVVDYSDSGYRAVAAVEVIEVGGNRRAIKAGSDVRLAEILGVEFVYCRRGDVGVYWNPKTRSLQSDLGDLQSRWLVPRHVMSTVVQRVE